jgi:predicted peptidase
MNPTSLARVLIACLACACWGCAHFRSKEPPVETGYVIQPYESPTAKRTRQYAMFVPNDYNKSKRKWPLILFLHGHGESGEDVNLLLKHGPIKEGVMRPDFPFLVVAPQCPKPQVSRIANAWRDLQPDVLQIIDEVKSKYRVDTNHFYLTGLSMGGFGSFQYLHDFPDRFAAAAPICGGGSAETAKVCARTPIWIFHGQLDRVVPPNRSVEMYETIKAFGGDVKLTIYPDLNHDSWTRTYENDDLYAWFLSHDLKSRLPRGGKKNSKKDTAIE